MNTMAASDTQTSDPLLARAFAASSPSESRSLYDQWASTYDTSMSAHNFTAPQLVAAAVARGLKTNHIAPSAPLSGLKILDAGCGTGLVGIALSQLGATAIVGVDFSEGMLAVAQNTRAYNELRIADLTQRLEFGDATFDALTCCGVFTHGHLGPKPLEEFVRVVKCGGVVVATVLESFWNEQGFERVMGMLEAEAKVDVVEKKLWAYREGVEGRVLVLRKL